MARFDSRDPRQQVEEATTMSPPAKKKAKPHKATAPKKTKASERGRAFIIALLHPDA